MALFERALMKYRYICGVECKRERVSHSQAVP